MYSVVHFPDENSVEGVPKKWVRKGRNDKTFCYWPPSTFKRNLISKLVKEVASPSEDWCLYPCVIKFEVADYNNMLTKAKEAEIATTEAPSSSDGEEPSTSNQKKRTLQSDSESSFDLPSPPPKRKKIQMNSELMITMNF